MNTYQLCFYNKKYPMVSKNTEENVSQYVNFLTWQRDISITFKGHTYSWLSLTIFDIIGFEIAFFYSHA